MKRQQQQQKIATDEERYYAPPTLLMEEGTEGYAPTSFSSGGDVFLATSACYICISHHFSDVLPYDFVTL